MNVKFRVLWFEDSPTWLKNEKENVEDLLKKFYLVPEIDCFDGEKIDEEIITDRKYDLILMDYKLAEEETGDYIAKLIRSHKVLTDILLYSTYIDELYEAIREGVPELDGIYITKRDTKTFKEKVAGIIEKIIKRSEDIVNLRGFVLDNTSDFETRITSLLTSCYALFEVDDKKDLKEKMKEKIEEGMDGRKKTLDKYLTSDDFFDLTNKEHTLTDISTKLSVLQVVISLLKTKYKMPNELCCDQFREYYMSMVGTYRNKLGHVKADESEIIISGHVEKIDEELHKKLRKNVTDVDNTIRQLEKYVDNLPVEY